MANLYLQNPIVITSNMTQSYKSLSNTVGSGLGSFTYLLIEKIIWESPVTVADKVLITDPDDGAVLLPLTCEVSGQSQIIDWTAKPKRWRDFEVSEINSGTLYIYTV